MAINTPSADENDPFSRETAQKMSFSDGVAAESPKSPQKPSPFVRKRPDSSLNPLTGVTFQTLLKAFYGPRYMKDATTTLNMSESKLSSTIYLGRTLRPDECRKLRAQIPRILRGKEEWVNWKISKFHEWLENERASYAKYDQLLTQAEREAERIAAAKRR